MSSTLDDVPDATAGQQAQTEPETYIELVSATGARDLAVLIYRSSDLDTTAFAPASRRSRVRTGSPLRSAGATTSQPAPAPTPALGRRARRNAHQDRDSRNDLATHAEVAQVRRVLALLDPARREELELVYFEGYSVDRGQETP